MICNWLSRNTSFKGAKAYHLLLGTWNKILALLKSVEALLFTSQDSARFLPSTKLKWILESWKRMLICVVLFSLLQQQDLLQNKNTVMASGKNKVQNHTQWKPPTLFWWDKWRQFLTCSFLKRHIQCGKIFQIYILYNKISSN